MHRSGVDSPRRNNSAGRTVVMVLGSAVDCDAMALWCQHRVDCDSIECTSDLEQGLELCRRIRPRLLAVDPASAATAVERATVLLRRQLVEHLLVLDDWPKEVRLAGILHEPAASYYSRTASPEALARAIGDILDHGRRVFDPALAPRVRRTDRGLEFDHSPEAQVIMQLTERERQVLVLLAQGKSVRDCAADLKLSTSTIDNHKCRLMKKLGVHKSWELFVCAIRQGLIPPFR